MKEYEDTESKHGKVKNRREKMKEIEKESRVDKSKNKIEGLAKDSSLENLSQTSSLGQEQDHMLSAFGRSGFRLLVLQSSM